MISSNKGDWARLMVSIDFIYSNPNPQPGIQRCKVTTRPRYQGSLGQHGAHLGPVCPRWAPCWPHEPCYQGFQTTYHELMDTGRCMHCALKQLHDQTTPTSQHSKVTLPKIIQPFIGTVLQHTCAVHMFSPNAASESWRYYHSVW